MKSELYDVSTTDFPSFKMPYSNIKINLHSLKTDWCRQQCIILDGDKNLPQNL